MNRITFAIRQILAPRALVKVIADDRIIQRKIPLVSRADLFSIFSRQSGTRGERTENGVWIKEVFGVGSTKEKGFELSLRDRKTGEIFIMAFAAQSGRLNMSDLEHYQIGDYRQAREFSKRYELVWHLTSGCGDIADCEYDMKAWNLTDMAGGYFARILNTSAMAEFYSVFDISAGKKSGDINEQIVNLGHNFKLMYNTAKNVAIEVASPDNMLLAQRINSDRKYDMTLRLMPQIAVVPMANGHNVSERMRRTRYWKAPLNYEVSKKNEDGLKLQECGQCVRINSVEDSEEEPNNKFGFIKNEKIISSKSKGQRARIHEMPRVCLRAKRHAPVESVTTRIAKKTGVLNNDIRAIIFDLDGVLSDSERAHLKTFNQIFAKYGVKPMGISYWLRNYTGKGSQFIVEDVIEKNGIGNVDAKELMKEREKIFSKLIIRGEIKPVLRSKELVKLAKKQRLKIIVASGGHRTHVRAQLKALGLSGVKFLGMEDVKNRKPAPDVFLRAAKVIGISPANCLVIEDAASGLQAAKKAGMKCVLIGNHHPKRIRDKANLWIPKINLGKIRAILTNKARTYKG